MNLQPATRGASVGPAHVVVFGQQRPLQRRRCGALSPAVVHEPAVLAPGDDLGVCIAQDRLQRLPADSWARFEDNACLAVGPRGFVSIHDHGDVGGRGLVRDETLDQGGGLSPGPSRPPQNFHQDSSSDGCTTM